MEKQIAENLINELNNQWSKIPRDNERFLKVLISTDIKESSSRFYETLPENSESYQRVPDIEKEHEFHLEMVLRNKNAQNYKLSPLKELYEILVSVWEYYPYDFLTRKIRANPDLVKMMATCKKEEPFSLLGKLKTYETIDNEKEKKTYIIERPVLIIPGVQNSKIIENWENKWTTKTKDSWF